MEVDMNPSCIVTWSVQILMGQKRINPLWQINLLINQVY